MITDKFKGYNLGRVVVNLYGQVANGYTTAVVNLGRKAASATVVPVGEGNQERFKLTIVKHGELEPNVSYWSGGDTAIQVAIDSMTP